MFREKCSCVLVMYSKKERCLERSETDLSCLMTSLSRCPSIVSDRWVYEEGGRKERGGEEGGRGRREGGGGRGMRLLQNWDSFH